MADRVRRGGGIRVPTAIRDRATARETRYYFLIGSLFAKLARGIRDCRVTRELFIIFGRAEGEGELSLPFSLLRREKSAAIARGRLKDERDPRECRCLQAADSPNTRTTPRLEPRSGSPEFCLHAFANTAVGIGANRSEELIN